MSDKTSNFITFSLIGGTMLFGTINTVAMKVTFSMDGKNMFGGIEAFEKPWWSTFLMFIGEALCLPAYFIMKFYDNKNKKDDKQLHLNPTGSMGYGRFILIVLLLSTCDLLSSTLSGISMLYCSASITQMLRGFLIVFVLFTGRMFLKRIPQMFHVFGVVMVIVGLILVGLTAMLNTSGENSAVGQIFIGIALNLAGQAVSSIQMIIEEKIMKGTDSIPPLFLAGFEGVCGTLLCVFVFFPALYFIPGNDHGSQENFINAAYMFAKNPLICGLMCLYTLSVAVFNFIGFTMSKLLTSAHRALISTLSPAVVWLVMIILYYSTVDSKPAHGNMPYGEELNWFSLIEAFGFVWIIVGNLIHNNVNGFGSKVLKTLKINDGEVKCCQPTRKYKTVDYTETINLVGEEI
ncbi:EamA-like_transporter family protein [Hexamita inflata]|uniref:EamA-like_transporter family protein n=1 Tax=Hexamita inflata TaxID=28002 RepID=A0ABP1H6Y1_9EUKA